jgi:hypothetical protein
MELHKNARTCPASRILLVQRVLGGMPVTSAADTRGGIGWEFVHVAIDDASPWLTPRSCPTRDPRPPRRSSDARSPGSKTAA